MDSLKGKRIIQVGIIVKDAEKAARRYGELFGIGPWRLFDSAPTDVILHGKPLANYDGVIRVAMANLGEIQFELLQPLHGPSTHMDFAKQHGQGIHHISFGPVPDHDDMLAALRKEGYGIEMQGVLGGARTFTYMATQQDLGTIFEFVKAPPGLQSTTKDYGSYTPQGASLISMKGKRIFQLGIIVKDAEKAAKRLWDLFGVGPWKLADFPPANVVLHDKPVDEEVLIRAALGNLGDLQFELLQPLRGPSTHMEFARQHGQGIHHLSFGQVPDHDEMLAAMRKAGYGIEMQGGLGGGTFTYVSTQEDLGTIFEFVKRSGETTAKFYGTYPPSG